MTLRTKLVITSAATWLLCLSVFLFSVFVLDANEVLNSQNWVSRSGTIILIVAALSEWRTLKRVESYRRWVLKCSIVPKTSEVWSNSEAEIEQNHIEPVRAIVEWSNIFLLIVGTVLTGYGDLLYKSTFSPLG